MHMCMWASRDRPSRRRSACAAHLVSPHYNASLCAGIINSEGRLWKSQRRFLHDKLREFGMTYMGNGKKIMEGRIKVCYLSLWINYAFNLSLWSIKRIIFFYIHKRMSIKNINELICSTERSLRAHRKSAPVGGSAYWCEPPTRLGRVQRNLRHHNVCALQSRRRSLWKA